MKPIVVISDIHGSYDALVKLVQKAYRKDRRFIFLGDYVDRGSDTKKTIDFLIKFQQRKNDTIFLRGNHDECFLEWVEKGSLEDYLYMGGLQTIESYWNKPIDKQEDYEMIRESMWKNYRHHISFLKQTQLSYEEGQYFFCHAGINPFLQDWRNSSKDDFLWIRERFINHKNEADKTIVFGHTPTVLLHDKDEFDRHGVWFEDNKIGVDGGYTMGGKLNALVIEKQTMYTYHVTPEEVEEE